jgi:hypothetical protein
MYIIYTKYISQIITLSTLMLVHSTWYDESTSEDVFQITDFIDHKLIFMMYVSNCHAYKSSHHSIMKHMVLDSHIHRNFKHVSSVA